MDKDRILNEIDDPYPCNVIIGWDTENREPIHCPFDEHDPFSRICFYHRKDDVND